MEPAARYPRSLRRVVAAATTLAVSAAVVAVPEVPGVGLQRAEAQQAIQLPPELRNASVSNNGSTWEATVFFEKPMEVRSVTLDFVPPSSTGANNSRNDSAADDDPILNVIPLQDTYNVVHYKQGGTRPVGTYTVTGFKSLGKSPSNRNTIRLTYELPPGTRVNQGDRLVLQAPGKAGVFPTPYLGASRFTNAWVNGGAIAGSVDGLPKGASVTVSAVNASGYEIFKQDGVRGAYQIPDVQPGNYTMRVSEWEGYSFSPVNGVPVSVEMNAQETANFTFSRDGGVVAGSVDGLPEGASVTVSVVNAAGDVVDKRDGVRGVYEIDGLDPGDYTVRVSGWKGYSSSPVNGVPVSAKKDAQETANFNFSRDAGVVAGSVNGLPQGASVTVRVVDASGREVGKQDGVRGTYRIPGVPTGDYTVRVSGWADYSSSPVDGVPVSVKKDAQETANFNFSREKGTVAGRVVGPDGRGVSGVTVQAGERTARTNANGDYTISDVPTGDTTIKVVGGVPGGYSVSGEQSKNVTTAGVSGVNFTTSREKGTVAGRVVGPDGRGVGGVTVQAGERTARTNANGDYTIVDVPTGLTTIKVVGGVPNGYSVSGEQSKNVTTAGVSGVNFTTTREKGSVSGRVTGPDGRGVSGVTVQAGERSARTNANGDYTISDVPTGDTTIKVVGGVPGGYSVSGEQSKNVTTAGVSGVNFTTSREKGTVAGRVTGPDGRGVSGVTVQAGERTARTNANGDYTIFDVPTGDTTIKVVGGVPNGYSVSGEQSKNVTTAGVSGVDFTTSRDAGVVAGSVNGLPQGASVTVRVVDASGREVGKQDGVRGTYRIPGVPTGDYTVRVSGWKGYSSSPVDGVPVSVKKDAQETADFNFTRQTGSVSGVIRNLPSDKPLSVVLTGADAATRGVVKRSTPVSGAFTIPGVPTGTYDISLAGQSDEFSFNFPKQITVNSGAANEPGTLEITAERHTGSVVGEVVGVPAGVTLRARLTRDGEASREATVSNGAFRFDGIPTGSYTFELLGAPAGYSVSGLKPVVVEKDATARPKVTLSADAVTVTGSFTGEDKKPLPGTKVEFKQGDKVVRELEADEQGKVRDEAFPPGEYTVVVTPPTGYEAPKPVEVTVKPGEEFTLDPVRVVRSTGSVVGEVVGVPAGVTLRARLTLQGETPREATVTGGGFTFDRIPTGSYKLELLGAPAGYSVSGLKPVVVEKDATAKPKVVLSADAVTVTGSFTGEGDKPLPGTKVEFKQGDEVVRELVSDEQGAVRDEAFPPGEYTVVVTPPTGYEAPKPVEVTVKPGEEFTLDPVRVVRSTGSVVGEVVGVPAGVTLRARLTLQGETPREATVTGGGFTFDRIPTGSYKLELLGVPAGYSVSGLKPVVVEKDATAKPKVVLSADAVTVTGSFTGEGDKPLPGTKVEFKQGDEVVRELVSDEQGAVRDEAFPPGEYTVVVTPPTGYEAPKPVEVTVKPGGEFTLDPVRVVRSTGSVVGEVVGAPAGVTLRARLTRDGEASREATVSNGAFRFDGIPTGSYTFELLGAPAGYSVSGLKPVVVEKDATARPKVVLSADAVTVTGSFTGEGDKPLPGTKVEFKQGDEVVRELVSDEQGKVRDEAFPPGDYTVVVTPPTGYEAPKPVEVTVKPGDDFELGSVSITPSKTPDIFTWDNLRVAPGEVKVVTPDRSAGATEEVTFQTEKITQPDGTEVTVAPGQSWLEIESDGTVVARPPADTAPGSYQLEVVASTGERDTVTVEVSPAPSMADRYKVDSQAVEVPAGSERRSSRPRASVREGAFTHANQPLPNGTTFAVDHKGASVDALGRVTFTPDANAKPGPVRIPVNVTFPDKSTATFDVVFNVGEPLLATQHPLTYPANANAPHKRTTAVQAMGQVPEGTRFALADDVELGNWFVSVDSVTGRLRAIPPSENAAPAEVKVVAYFTDGSTSELTTTLVAQKADFNVGGKTGLTYGSTVTQIGEQTTLKPQGPVKPGTRFAIDETFAKNGWDPRIDPKTGAITVRTDDTVPAGEQVLLPVVVALPDGSLETVEVPLRAVDKQKPSDGRTRAETTEGSSTSDWVVVLIGALVAIGGLTVALAMNEREVRRVLEKYGITW